MRFIVIGAGLSGLSCGVALAMNGHDVIILEREKEIGGLARSVRIDGYTFDYGPHYLFGPKVLSLLREVLAPEIELMDVKRVKERIHFEGKYVKFPFEPKNLLLNVELPRVPGVLFDLFIRNITKGLHRRSTNNVEDWVIRSVGKRIYDYTSLGRYIEKLYGIAPREVSGDWGIQKLKFLARLQNANLLQLAVRALREEKNLERQVVSYPLSGIDQLAIHIGNKFSQLSGKIYFGSETTMVKEERNGISVAVQKDEDQEIFEGDFAVSTIPITELLRMIKPPPAQEIVTLSNSLRYRAALLLLLCVDKDRAMDHQCIYFTEKDFKFRRITEFKNLDNRMAPVGKTSLCVEITCFENEKIFQEDKECIFDGVVGDLERSGFLRLSDVEKYHLVRLPYAYPVYDRNYRFPLAKALETLMPRQSIISLGRQGLFFYNTMSNSITKGYVLGQKLSNLHDSDPGHIIEEVYRGRLQMYK